MLQPFGFLSDQFNLDSLMNLINLQSDNVGKFTIIPTNKVSVWTGQDNVTTWNQGTDANRPLLTDGVVFDGSNDFLARTSDITATDYSFYCVVRYLGVNTGTVANKSLFSSNTANDWLGFNVNYNITLNVSASSRRIFLAGVKGNRHVVLGMRKTGNNFVFTVNDRVCLQTGSVATASTLFGRLGNLVNYAGFNANMNLKSFCLSSTVYSDVHHQQIVDYLYNRYNLSSNTVADTVIGFGDSNTFGQGTTSYLVELSSQMNLAHLNLGISGTLFVNTTGQTNNGYSRYASQIITKPYTDYVVIQYGTNDILSGQPASTYEIQMNAMVADLIAKGYNASRICLCSNPYQVGGQNATLLNEYRTKILSIATTHGTKYFDLLQSTRDNGGNSLLSDPVHLNAAGMTLWANGVYAAFTS